MVLAVAVAGSPVAPDAAGELVAEPEPEPRSEEELERAAQAAFAAEDYAQVVSLAAEAYALTGALRHLYAQAHAERFAGDCQAALALYARVLAADPGGPFGSLSRDGIRLCEERLATEVEPPAPTPEPPPPAVPAATTPAPPPVRDDGPDEPRQERRWIADPVGGVVLGFGVAALAVGTGLAVAASSATRAAESAGDERDYAADRRRSRTLAVGGIASLAAGGLLVAGAAIRYATVARRLRLSAGVSRYGIAVAVTRRF